MQFDNTDERRDIHVHNNAHLNNKHHVGLAKD